jgi:tetratricopeptide (TPR) repeat protein
MSVNARRHLAWYLTMAGMLERAEKEWRQVLAEARALVGDRHLVVCLIEAGLAHCLADLGQTTEALDLSEQALRTAEAIPSIAPDQIAHVRLSRAHALCRAGRVPEALPQCDLAWDDFYHLSFEKDRWRHTLIEDACASARERDDAPALARWEARRAARENSP